MLVDWVGGGGGAAACTLTIYGEVERYQGRPQLDFYLSDLEFTLKGVEV